MSQTCSSRMGFVKTIRSDGRKILDWYTQKCLLELFQELNVRGMLHPPWSKVICSTIFPRFGSVQILAISRFTRKTKKLGWCKRQWIPHWKLVRLKSLYRVSQLSEDSVIICRDTKNYFWEKWFRMTARTF